MRETELYPPIKAFLESQAYVVKAEVKGCDVVAIRDGQPPVIVELKTSLSLALLLQGIDRQSISDFVYLAIPRRTGMAFHKQMKHAVKLCRRLGLGLISVRLRDGVVQVHCDPAPYQPRKFPARASALLGEFHARQGDGNIGGQVGRKQMTAYRQDAMRLRDYLAQHGAHSPRDLAKATDVPRAGVILRDNHYGWFYRVTRGVYDVVK